MTSRPLGKQSMPRPGPGSRPWRSRAARRGGAILASAALLVLAACSGGASEQSTDDGTSAGGGTVTVGATLEPTSLDLTSVSGAAIPQVLLYNVYETLVKIDPSSGELAPLLAQDWEVSDDGLTYTFNLVPDATFHDGQPLLASDVVWSLERVRDPDAANPFAAQMDVVDTIEAPDESTVVVTLSQPSNRWLFDMASQTGVILKEGATDLETSANGTGPFTFENWNRGSDITLAQAPEYWGEPASLDEVVFTYITDPNALNNAMLSGQLDVLSNVQAPQLLETFQSTEEFEVVEGQTTGEVVLGMNNAAAPLDDVRVRRAIRHAINKPALLDTVWSGYGELIGSMVPPSDPWYEDLTGTFEYDPERAQQLLDAAGYGPGDITLRMPVPPPGYARSAAPFIVSALEEVGITVEQDNIEMPQWLDSVFNQADYDLTIISHVEPRDIVQYGNPDYYWNYDDEQTQNLLASADQATDDAERNRLYQQVARRISDQAVSDWLFVLPNLQVIRDGVQGFPADAYTLSFDMTGVELAS
ncbi:MAG TPA: ABC transporter substrate-binding protein [Jiangellaceae bacterium]|nr:ABC transporter substrate-binding protein [Jiangellaceae bacterium]